jgi:hypothetical protein
VVSRGLCSFQGAFWLGMVQLGVVAVGGKIITNVGNFI